PFFFAAFPALSNSLSNSASFNSRSISAILRSYSALSAGALFLQTRANALSTSNTIRSIIMFLSTKCCHANLQNVLVNPNEVYAWRSHAVCGRYVRFPYTAHIHPAYRTREVRIKGEEHKGYISRKD